MTDTRYKILVTELKEIGNDTMEEVIYQQIVDDIELPKLVAVINE